MRSRRVFTSDTDHVGHVGHVGYVGHVGHVELHPSSRNRAGASLRNGR